jgi:hypothetical protein
VRYRYEAMANKPKIFEAPPDGFAMAPVHPGEVLHEEIAARGLTAHALGLKPRAPANRLTEIINGKRGVSPDTSAAPQPPPRPWRRVLAEFAEPVRLGDGGETAGGEDQGGGRGGVSVRRPVPG